MPIAAAFERDGEEAFRAREAEVVGSLLEEADGGAIALGGGSVLSERIREALGRHVVVWLQVDAEEAWRRIARSDRPLARSAEDVARLLAVRLPLYEELADAVIPPGDRRMVGRALPSIRALAELPQGTRMLWATSASGEYPVFCRAGASGRRLVAAGEPSLLRHRHRSRPPLRRSCRAACRARRGRAGGGGEDDGRGGAGAARAGPRRDDPRGPRRRARRRRRRRPRRLLRPHLPARRCRSSRCRPRSSPRSTPPTAARPASTCPRARTTPAPTTCRRRCSPTPRP